MARKFLALFAIVIPLALVACGGDDETSTSASSDTSTTEATTESSTAATGGGGGEAVELTETEYKIDPADPTVKAGTVTFDIANDGSTIHNLEIEGDGVEEESEDIDAGDSTQLTVDLEPGSYEMYCAIDGHKDLGMEGELTVQ